MIIITPLLLSYRN